MLSIQEPCAFLKLSLGICSKEGMGECIHVNSGNMGRHTTVYLEFLFNQK